MDKKNLKKEEDSTEAIQQDKTKLFSELKEKAINANVIRNYLRHELILHEKPEENKSPELDFSPKEIEEIIKENDEQVISFMVPFIQKGEYSLLEPLEEMRIMKENDTKYEYEEIAIPKDFEKGKTKYWRYKNSDKLNDYYKIKKINTTIKYIYLGLRRLTFGFNHWAPILELSDGKYATVNYCAAGLPFLTIAEIGINIFDTLHEAAYAVAGQSSKVRLVNYGPPLPESRSFINYLSRPRTGKDYLYIIGSHDCQNFSRKEIKLLTGKVVQTLPTENGRRFKFI